MFPPAVWPQCLLKGVHSVLGSHPNHTDCNWWFWTNVPSGYVFCSARQITFILRPSSKQGLIPWMTKWHILFMLIVAFSAAHRGPTLLVPSTLLTPGGVAFVLHIFIFSTTDRAMVRATYQRANKALCLPDGQHTVIYYHKPHILIACYIFH